MKKFTLFSLLILLVTQFSLGQVSINPGAIEVDQPVTITVDLNSEASNCNGLNNPQKVYMHSGIGDNTNAFGFSVIGNWGQDDGVGEMTNNGDGTYSITITPQDYYGLSQTQADNATQIGMVFRNPDGTQELKASGCQDFIFLVGLININILNPANDLVVLNSGDNLLVRANLRYLGNIEAGSFQVFFNDAQVANGNGFPTFQTTLTNITQSGTVRIVGSPFSNSEVGEGSFQVVISPTVTEQAKPAGTRDGINYDPNDATKATLVVSAPGKEFIEVAGSFNNYTPTSDYLMKKDPSTNQFWLELTGLTPGAMHHYQYWVYDTNPIAGSPSLVKTADPYSTLVLSPFDDPGIPAASFPNIPAYPAGQQREVTVLQTGQTPYDWQVTNFEKPKMEDLVIYEVLIRDFDINRNYQDLINRIDYFKNLNVNAIQLMPVMEYEGNESWGYNTSFHMALDKYYGTPQKFKEFVDVCHQNGIAVILDIALNHAFGRNPMVRMWMDDPDGDGWGGPADDSPYFNKFPTHSFNVGNDFNHQQPLTQEYTRRVVEHWITEYNIDGFRWDLTKGFTQNCGNGTFDGDFGCTQNYQQDRVDVLKEYADYSWSLDDTHYVIFEHLGSDNEEQQWANYRINEGKGIMLWGKMTDQYNELTMGQNGNKNFDRAGHLSRGFNDKRLIAYAESHDEERLMYKNLQFGNSTNSSHDVKNLNVALSRMSALGAVTLTIPGPKMIWHFGELGMEQSIFTCNNGTVNEPGGGGDCKLDTKPQPQWVNNWTSDALRSQIYSDWARMNDLKINEPVFEGDYTINSGGFTPKIFIFDTSIPNDQLRNVIVYANFGVNSASVSTDFPYGGTWYDLMDETNSTTIDGSTANITLQAGEFRILGNAPPETLSVDSVNALAQLNIYPNPANTEFSLNTNTNKVMVIDITGKAVKSFTGDFTATTQFDISDLNQGLYLVNASNNSGQSSTSKLVKL
ncbi:alpha-amylase family glycosyl hydrolase [Paucihalobacter sp.]|uniref:alpha-amylase family glycosyl hydrolase n=1 Tax=Paucihalobacter sp. TaxID=2850405 RepID=UPI002FE39D57